MSTALLLPILEAVYQFVKLIISHESDEKRAQVAKDLAEGLRLKNESKDTSLLEKAVREHLVTRDSE